MTLRQSADFWHDNRVVLKTLEQEFTGKIKCIYIDFSTNQLGIYVLFYYNIVRASATAQQQ